jgi:Spy/CpxP family protein refolding chaperone
MKKKTFLTLITSGALITAGLAYAQPNNNMTSPNSAYSNNTAAGKQMRMHGNKGMKDPMSRLAMKLNLTQEQRDTIRAQIEKSRPDMIKYRDEMINSEQSLRQMMISNNFDKATISKLAKQKGDAVAKLTELRMQNKAAMMKVLTPEQLNKFKAMQQQRQAKHGSAPSPTTGGF